MKKLLATLTALLSVVAIARALVPVTLAWDYATSSSVDNYRIYYGPAPGVYTNSVTVCPATPVVPFGCANTVSISNLVVGSTYYFAAISISTNGLESNYSVEIFYTVPTNAPPGVPGPPVLQSLQRTQ